MLVSVLFCAYSKLDPLFLSLTAIPFFPPLPFRLPLPLSLSIPPSCGSRLVKQKEKYGREKIESEIVGVIDKIGWQRWVDKRGMAK